MYFIAVIIFLLGGVFISSAFSKATYGEFLSLSIEFSTYSINLRFLAIFSVPSFLS